MDDKNFLTDIYDNLIKLPETARHKKEPLPPQTNVDSDQLSDLTNIDKALTIWLKTIFASHVLVITYGWLIFLVLILIGCAVVNYFAGRPALSDAVLITLLSGTSLSVIVGMIMTILRYLFDPNNK